MKKERESQIAETSNLGRRGFLTTLVVGGGTLLGGTVLGGCRSLRCAIGRNTDGQCVSDFTRALREIEGTASPAAIDRVWRPALAGLDPTGRAAAVATLEVAQRSARAVVEHGEVPQSQTAWREITFNLSELRHLDGGVDVDDDEDTDDGGSEWGGGEGDGGNGTDKGNWCGGACGDTAGDCCGFWCIVSDVEDLPLAVDVDGLVVGREDFELIDREALPRAIENATRAYEKMFRSRYVRQ